MRHKIILLEETMKKAKRTLSLLLTLVLFLGMIPLFGINATASDNVYPQVFDLGAVAPNMSLVAHFDFEGLTAGSTAAIPSLGGLNAQARPMRQNNSTHSVSLSTNVPAGGGTHSYSLGGSTVGLLPSGAQNSRWLNVVKNDGTALLSDAIEFVASFDVRRESGNWPFYVDHNQAANSGGAGERYIGVHYPNATTMNIERFSFGRPGDAFNARGTVPNVNIWYNVTIVARPFSTALYINGNLVQSRETNGDAAYTLPNLFGANGGWVQLGKANWTASGEFFTGLIDNVMIYAGYPIPVTKAALAAEIARFAGLNQAGFTAGSWLAAINANTAAVAVINNADATQEQVDSAAATLKAAIDNLVISTSDVDFAALLTAIIAAPAIGTDFTPASWQAYQAALSSANQVLHNADATQVEVDAALAALQAAIAALVPSPAFERDMLVHYDFTNVAGTQVRDSSGRNNHGTLFNNAQIIDVPNGDKALNLATGTQHLQMPQGFMNGAANNNYTVSAYMKQSETRAAAWLVSLANSSSAGYSFIAPNTGSGNLRFAKTSTNWNNESGINAAGLVADRWYHIVARQNGNQMTLFVDGIQVGQATTTLRIGTILTATHNQNYLGRSAYSADPYWRGQISDFRIYNTALSNTDIQGLFDAVKIVDPFEISDLTGTGVRSLQVEYNHITREIIAPVVPNTDLTNLPLSFKYNENLVTISPDPETVTDYSKPVQYTLTTKGSGEAATYTIFARTYGNPILPGTQADPEILLYDGKYYIYSTSCGLPGWGGWDFRVYSSYDLVTWEDEGVILDMRASAPYLNHKGVEVGVVPWASGNAWAPGIIEKDGLFYYYFSGHVDSLNQKATGVAIAPTPVGPFVSQPNYMIRQSDLFSGQAIDACVFRDPVSEDHYLYIGQSTDVTAWKLNDNMVSVDASTRTRIRIGSTFREGIFVYYHEGGNPSGNYYFTWSEDDTGAIEYKVRYGVSNHPLGSNPGGTTTGNPSRVNGEHILIRRDLDNRIYATGHHSVVQVPGVNRWFIAYHRFQRFGGAGHIREVCLDEFFYAPDGSIPEIKPTLEGVLYPMRVGDLTVNVRDAAATLEVNALEAVRHNITLPTEGRFKTTITWKSSHPDIITDEVTDGKAPGVVNRPVGGDPVEVILTATIFDPLTEESLEKEFTANVIPIPADLDTDYSAGYLWTYFNSTSQRPTGTSGTTNERFKIFYGYSFNGLHWDTLNRTGNTARPVAESIVGFMGVRDPHIIRSADGDMYWIIGTDLQDGFDQVTGSKSIIVWESTDLINWTDSRLELVFPHAGNVWAPEAIYDPDQGDFLVYWASRDTRQTGNANRLRVYVSRTRDFRTFTDPVVWVDEQLRNTGSGTWNTIDTTITYANGNYYRYHTSDWFTLVDFCPTLSTNINDWTPIISRPQSDTLGLDRMEGHQTYQLPDGRWCMMGDNSAYRGFWIENEDFHSQIWTINARTSGLTHSRSNTFRSGTTNVNFRHGTVLRMSWTEERALMEAMGAGHNYNPAPRYSVYVKNGTVNPFVAVAGTTTTVNYVSPGSGIQFLYWEAEGIELTEEQRTATTLTFVQPENDVRLYAITNRAVTSVQLSESELDLIEGTQYILTAAIRPTDAVRTLEWTSSDESVATVDENGKVSAISLGTATITATSAINPAIYGICVIEVVEAVIESVSNASFLRVSNKNKITTVTFTATVVLTNGSSEKRTYEFQVNANNNNIDGRYVFPANHELAGFTLTYDIKGNGSNIKAFSIR